LLIGEELPVDGSCGQTTDFYYVSLRQFGADLIFSLLSLLKCKGDSPYFLHLQLALSLSSLDDNERGF